MVLLLGSRDPLFGCVHIQFGVVQVDIGEDRSKEGLRLVQAGFESFDILRGRVPTAVRGLIVGALYGMLATCKAATENCQPGGIRTIAVDRAVCTGLFPVTLDLLPSAFITGAANPAPLLHRQRLGSGFGICRGDVLRGGGL